LDNSALATELLKEIRDLLKKILAAVTAGGGQP
jgi:hypothetical protein